jgi:Ca2+-dependent lipid-binding protein
LKTKVKDYAGKTPIWNEEFQFDVEDTSQEIFLRVWDQDMLSSDAVGFVKLKTSSLMINCGVDEWFTIYYQNESAGEVHLISSFAPEGGDQYA